jgi:hypothetical protein
MSEAVSTPTDPRWSSTQALIVSLKQDYDAGRLPPEIVERVEALRDEFYASARQRGVDVAEDVGPNLDRFLDDLQTSMNAVMVLGDEVVDTAGMPAMIRAIDAAQLSVEDQVFDAAVDVGRSALDFAADLVEVRGAHDSKGEFAELLQASRAELDDGRTAFEDSVEAVLDNRAESHAAMQKLADDVEQENAEHGPVQIIHKTSIDPRLPEQIEQETGQVET